MRNPALLFACRFSVLVLLISAPVHAADTDQLALIIREKSSTTELLQQAITAGQERALLCSVCHGEDGNSVRPDVPNLAGQNPVYLLDQIDKFSDGRRKNFVMNSLAKNFTTDDKINLAIFYNSMPVKAVAVDEQLARQGKQIYMQSCSTCHGAGGGGSTSFARIAGQQPIYVFNTLRQFRDNATNQPNNAAVKRTSIIMEPIVKKYSDQELEMVSAFIARLQ